MIHCSHTTTLPFRTHIQLDSTPVKFCELDTLKEKRMGKSVKFSEVYLRFIQLSEALRDLPILIPLEPLEERILMIVANARQTQERLSVKDLMSMSDLGSPAMLHGRLKSMREKGWIFLAETEDARRKQLELTRDALVHFDKLARCMMKALKETT
jgi:hypothetical protein